MNEKTHKTALVLGGYGFIGRHVVQTLRNRGIKVLIGSRNKTTCLETRCVHLHKITNAEQWQNTLKGVDVVINTVGILRQRLGETYEQVHHHAVASLAQACSKFNIKLVHVSILGLHNPVRSRFITSKRRGEQALLNSNADWFVVRPSIIDGAGGFGAKWLKRVAHWPIHFTPANATHKIAPIDVHDLADAIANLALRNHSEINREDRIYELSGYQTITLSEYLNCLRKIPPHNRHVAIPAWLARATSHICDILHVTPFSFGHYELLKYDNCPDKNRINELLERPLRKYALPLSTNYKPINHFTTSGTV